MLEFMQNLFASRGFMPHGHCYLWKPELVWLHVASDALIGLAYYSMPMILIYFVYKRRDLAFNWILLLFGAFIFACGTTHLLSVWTLWHPIYRLEGVIKLLTAGVSMTTAVLLISLIPKALALPNPTQLEAANRELERQITERKQAEEELRASEARLAGILDIADDAIISVDETQRITLFNQGAEKIFGYTSREILGQPLDVLLPSRFAEIHYQHFRAFAQSAATTKRMEERQEIWGRRKDGTEFPAEAAFSRLDLKGEKVFTAILRDISKRKQAQEELRTSETRLAGILDTADSAIISIDETQCITLFNQGAEKIFGYTSREVVGQPLDVLLPARFVESHRQHVRIFAQSAATARRMGERQEIFGRCKDGTEFPAEASISKLDLKGEKIFTVILRDISERKQVEEALRKAHSELEIRVQERTAELAKVNEVLRAEIAERKRAEETLARQAQELARSNAELEQFAYVASHDLQEPLRKVANYTQLLAQRYQGRLDAKADTFIAYIVDGTTRMSGLIRDLLTYSRVGRKETSFEPTPVQTILQQMLVDLEPLIRESGAVVTYDDLPTVLAIPTQLRQLLQNLISNAIKFRGTEPPRVHVSVEQKRTMWVFSVRDNGIGIDPQYAERIFGVFQRLHLRAEYPGTGIGLAICKKVVEQHGGRMWVESELGKGATFYFTIPVKGSEVFE